MASPKIHVLQVSKSTGGVGAYTRRLVKTLNKDKFKITVACLSKGAEEMASELCQIPGVTAFSVAMEQYKIDLFSDLRVLYKLYKVIRTEKFDIIHAHTSKPGFLARVAALGSKVPIIYRPANFSFYDGVPKWQIIIYVLLERLASNFTDRIMLVSQGERKLARRYNVGKDSQFVIIYTGIDINNFEPRIDENRNKLRAQYEIPQNALLIGTVARLTKDKAPLDFAEAAALAHAQYPNTHFIWVGDGPLEEALNAKIKQLNLHSVFHIVGHQKNVPEFLKAMDFFVLSSTSEALSIAMLEAMAAGLPVISTRVNGADEAIHDGESGFLVPIGDIFQLAEAIKKLLNAPQKIREMGLAARKQIEAQFSLSKMTDQVENLYEKTILISQK